MESGGKASSFSDFVFCLIKIPHFEAYFKLEFLHTVKIFGSNFGLVASIP